MVKCPNGRKIENTQILRIEICFLGFGLFYFILFHFGLLDFGLLDF